MSSLFFGSILVFNILAYLSKKEDNETEPAGPVDPVSLTAKKRIITASEIHINMKIISAYKRGNIQIGSMIEDCYGNTIVSTGICEPLYKYKVTHVTTLHDSAGKFADIIYNPQSGDIIQFTVDKNVELQAEQCNSIVSCLYLDPKCNQLQIMYVEDCVLCEYILNKGNKKNYTQDITICTMSI